MHARLMARAQGHPNDEAFAHMVASWAAGEGALPAWLGLSPARFRELFFRHFPGFALDEISATRRHRQIPPERLPERQELEALLLRDRARGDPSEVWAAGLLAAGCLADDHLWQDLGLWSRADLSQLLRHNFPALAARNVKDMKWKKFLYKQLCETEGIYTCRAPSCEQCADYGQCFGPEA